MSPLNARNRTTKCVKPPAGTSVASPKPHVDSYPDHAQRLAREERGNAPAIVRFAHEPSFPQAGRLELRGRFSEGDPSPPTRARVRRVRAARSVSPVALGANRTGS